MPTLLMAIAAIGFSGVPGVLLDRRGGAGQGLAAILAGGGAVVGIGKVVEWLAIGGTLEAHYPWPLLPGVTFHPAVDVISAIFLLPVFVLALTGSVYGLGYWRQAEHRDNGRKLRLFYGLCPAGMALLVVARNSVMFLLGWEIMALAAFMLVTTEDDQAAARRAGWIYLVATHIASLSLFAMFGLLWAARGTFDWLPPDPDAAPLDMNTATAVFLLALVGFGFKAGVMPLHFWLPGAHATAPSHVSALMSGVLLKMGIYGLVRVTSLFPDPPLWWGAALLALGVLSGVLGIACACGQHDLKRLMAYSSIENIGIIVMALGLAMIGRAWDRYDWVVLGLAAALLHVWNHSLFKALLFFCAGSVVHACGTRELDSLGGLSRPMPATALLFFLGAVAICGLPPLNGFVSEFLLYNGLLSTLGIGEGPKWSAAALAVPALGLIGALAAAAYIKAYGTAFLGAARSESARHAHEAPRTMLAPMACLAAACVLLGLFPMWITPLLDRAVGVWAWEAAGSGLKPVATLAPLGTVGAMGLALLAAVALLAVVLRLLLRRGEVESSVTWGCGYSAPTARMQYTSSSFAEMLGKLFAWVPPAHSRGPRIQALFPPEARFDSAAVDERGEELRIPAPRLLVRPLHWYRAGREAGVQVYLVCMFVVLLALLVWR
ncbi:MAG TPA: proton-conducting transporter membrane subunit [Pirellulales bacterium]|nr:proton-conducting transporter membrane subunit [Pirellulales bacterium]